MLRKLLVAVTMTAMMTSAVLALDEWNLDTANTVKDATTDPSTFIFSSVGPLANQPVQDITITDGHTLTIGHDNANAGANLDYTLKSIVSGGENSTLRIAKSAAAANAPTVTMNTLDFTKGGKTILANASILQINESATFTSGSGVLETDTGGGVLKLGNGTAAATLTFNGGSINAFVANPLTIQNNAAAGTVSTVVFNAGSRISGTVNAGTVDMVVNGTTNMVAGAVYTANNYTNNGGNLMGAAPGTKLVVNGDAVINKGMVRVDTLEVANGTYSIKTGGTGHANNLNVKAMASIAPGAVDMIMNGHTLATGGYTIEGDAFVKACRMAPRDSHVEFLTAGNSFTVKQYGILSVLENNLVINGTDSTFDVGGYFLTDHNARAGLEEGFCQVSEMSNAVIRDTAALVLGERQQYFYNAGLEAITSGDALIVTAAEGTITGMFNNVHEQANGWGYYSYFGDFDLEIKETPFFGEALGITKFTRSDYKDFSQNRAQLAKMGLNPNTAGIGMLQNLQNVARDLADFASGDGYDSSNPPVLKPIYQLQSSSVMNYGPSYDAGGNKGYEIGRMRLPGNNEEENYGYVAGRLNRDMLSSVVNGSRVFQTDRRNVKDSNYIGFINGTMDRALWEYVNAATITNVVRANQRSALAAADMVYDRLHRYQRTTTDLCAAFGSDTGMAAAILNQHYLNRFWVQGIGQWDEMDERDGFAGYDYDAYGFAVGYDRALGPVILGGSFAYTAGDYEDKWATSHDSDIDNYAFNLYATYSHRSGFFGTLVGGYTYSDNDINETRGNNRASQDFETNTWYVSGKLGYDWRPTSAFTLTPSVGLGYVHSRSKDHDGVYAGISHMRFSRATADTGFIPVELRANYDWVINECSAFSLNAKVGYTYNFDEDGATGTARLYELPGANPIRAVDRELGHHAWNLGVGVNYSYKRFDFGVNYDYVGMSDFDSHRVTASVGIGF